MKTLKITQSTAADGWKTRSESLGYKEYDFDLDPDGIFDVFK